MSDHKQSNKTPAWLIIGVIVLIALLIIWLTVADSVGDTDVAAQVFNLPAALQNLTA